MDRLVRRIGHLVGEIVFDLVVNRLGASAVVPRSVRWLVLRGMGMRVARSTIGPNVYFGSGRVEIGSGAQIGPQAFLDGAGTIVLEPRCGVGPRSMIITGAHEPGGPDQRYGSLAPEPVRIGEGAWLGAGVMVMPGVTVGAGCVVGAGALVLRDCAPHGLYVGRPARRVRDLDTTPGIR